MREETAEALRKIYEEMVTQPIDIADLAIAEHKKAIEKLEAFKRDVRAAGAKVTETPAIKLTAAETVEVKQIASALAPASGK